MKNIKRILAIIGIVLLAGLYLSTIVLALTDSSQSMNAFFASIVATVMIPTLIWAYTFIYRLVHSGKDSDEADGD